MREALQNLSSPGTGEVAQDAIASRVEGGSRTTRDTSPIVARLRHWRHFPRTGGRLSNLHRLSSNPITPAMSAPAPTKRLFIKTYGCQMNVYDSERMADVLSPLGYAITDGPEGADL